MANVELGLQFQVTETGGDDVAYYLNIGGGAAEMAPGELDGADVTVTNDYETAVAVSKGDLNTQMAFMQGKLKVSGNMAKLMMHQAVINEFASAVSAMDTEF
ncbi:MAG: SCP2 sterol-binding domain-containing protein [Acidimicrobiia bacterium]|nr:SCP2 sterol-binding domain-containing protein [Acidimicrobiia bacterium]NNC74285.1 SCP2 sterol-binding domain-containing protein [Acidimicrobiia bacterium]